MFTGIIIEVGKLVSVEPAGDSMRLKIQAEQTAGELAIGDSLAINGVCLTIEKIEGAELDFFATPETLDKTALGELKAGDPLNLEPSLKVGQSMGGHIVQGHVDSIATIKKIEDDGNGAWTFGFEFKPEISDFLVMKGSISVDGISLTIARLEQSEFEVAIIPHTYENTSLRSKKIGDSVNIECDIIARQISHFLNRYYSTEKPAGVTKELLEKAGY